MGQISLEVQLNQHQLLRRTEKIEANKYFERIKSMNLF